MNKVMKLKAVILTMGFLALSASSYANDAGNKNRFTHLVYGPK